MIAEPPNLLATFQARRTVDLAALRPDPIPHGTVLRLLEAANWAPSHGRTEPWRFAVFTGEGRRVLSDALATSLALIKGEPQADPEVVRAQRERQLLAPVWLAVAAEPAEKPKMPLHEEQWATVCAVQNLLLAARALGIASKWITNAPSMHEHTRKRLHFSERAHMMGLIYLGYPAGEWPQGERRAVEEKVRWVE
ncbi:nitroreductase family protein [Deinococcus hopiensis]|uniref:Putative NAD(P)H nitroreductase n=1 Tax=Deinococcus hopiensis KR-140 TaxID=695939 RepID=A0A1W1VP20_9DEIO|nr:nitroreductase [Deinococcus hopiensis]SMB94674.1 Nitroreductase [Deinococcus hopiensis KR-140]